MFNKNIQSGTLKKEPNREDLPQVNSIYSVTFSTPKGKKLDLAVETRVIKQSDTDSSKFFAILAQKTSKIKISMGR